MDRAARLLRWLPVLAAAMIPLGCGPGGGEKDIRLLNVSYDPTRELYKEYDQLFAERWERQSGQRVTVDLSNGGSGKQARAVIDGLEADVVTLALAYDIDAIQQKAGLLGGDWRSRLPHASCPYTSTIVFLVRSGNPKGIKDWDDLIKPGVSVVTPNPKTSGGARWNYLAAWGYVLKRELGNLGRLNEKKSATQVAQAEDRAQEFLISLFRNVPNLDTGARAATNTFAQRRMGDVLLAWENEALLEVNQFSKGQFEVVMPSVSILAEPPVAVVDSIVDKHGTRAVAEEYLKYLYSPAGQELAAKHYYRPSSPEVMEKVRSRFPHIELVTIDQLCGGWRRAQQRHFDDGGLFDQILKAASKE
jgi:sulfate transport system substrate-binding protein